MSEPEPWWIADKIVLRAAYRGEPGEPFGVAKARLLPIARALFERQAAAINATLTDEETKLHQRFSIDGVVGVEGGFEASEGVPCNVVLSASAELPWGKPR